MRNSAKFTHLTGVVAVLLSAIVLAVTPVSHAGPVRLYEYNQQGELRTNNLVGTAISANILANGKPTHIGVPFIITNNSSGILTNTFPVGWYEITNRSVRNSAYVINVFDSGSTVYDKTNVLESGYNTYVKTVYGTNPPPTTEEISSALGYLPGSSNSVYTASNSLQTQIDGIDALNANALTNGHTAGVTLEGGLTSTATAIFGANATANGVNYPGFTLNVRTTEERSFWDETGFQGAIFFNSDSNRVQVQTESLNDNTWKTLMTTEDNAASATSWLGSNTVPDLVTLLNPSRIGVGMGSTIWDGYNRTNGFCFYLPARTGIVRTISFQMTDQFQTAYARRDKIRFRVYADFGAAITNHATSEHYRLVDVPVGTLVSDSFRFLSNGPYITRYSSALVDAVVGTNDLNWATVHFRFKAGTQFTNGIAIGFWDEENNKAYTNGYFSTAYEVGALNPQFADYRLRIRAYATNSPPTTNGTTLQLFSVTGKSGLVAGWAEAWSWIMSSADMVSEAREGQWPNEMFSQMGEIPIIFETGGTEIEGVNITGNGFKAYYDWTPNSAWMSSGKDDFFHNSYAFTNAREWEGYDVGTPHRTLDRFNGTAFGIAQQESFRWLIHDTFYFDNELTATAVHVPQSTNMLYRAMLITYEK